MIAAPDRSKDISPPAHGTSRQCECGKRMIVRTDATNIHQGWMSWRWWCGCGHLVEGGRWHPMTAEESAQAAWEAVNAEVAAPVEPGRVIPPNCAHERKTVADGGWTCDDCGRVGTIAAIGDHMRAMPPAWRRKWCEEVTCETTECTGCASGKGGLRFWGFTKEQHDAWLRANPTAAEVMAAIEAAAAENPSATTADTLALAAFGQYRDADEPGPFKLAAVLYLAAHGQQEDVAVFS